MAVPHPLTTSHPGSGRCDVDTAKYEGPTSSKPWERGPTVEQMSHSQSGNTNTSIFYVHSYEKGETD